MLVEKEDAVYLYVCVFRHLFSTSSKMFCSESSVVFLKI